MFNARKQLISEGITLAGVGLYSTQYCCCIPSLDRDGKALQEDLSAARFTIHNIYIYRQPVIPTHPSVHHTLMSPSKGEAAVCGSSISVWDDWRGNHCVIWWKIKTPHHGNTIIVLLHKRYIYSTGPPWMKCCVGSVAHNQHLH